MSTTMVRMEQMETQVIVRRAEPRDKTGVLDINRNVYIGFDYLPYAYETLMEDPNYTYYLAELNGEVVAFYGVCVIDGGTTLEARSGRVKVGFEKLGLLSKILHAIYRDFMPMYEKNPELKIASAMGNTCKVLSSARFQNISRLVWKRMISFFTCPSDTNTTSAAAALCKDNSTNNSAHTSNKTGSTSFKLPDISCETLKETASEVVVIDPDSFCRFVEDASESTIHHLFPTGLFTIFTWHFQVEHLSASRGVWGRWDPLFTIDTRLLPAEQGAPSSSAPATVATPSSSTTAAAPSSSTTAAAPSSLTAAAPSSSPSAPPTDLPLSNSVRCDPGTASTARLEPANSGLLVACMTVPAPGGLVPFLDFFGTVTSADEVKPHLLKVLGWLRESQMAKYSTCEMRGPPMFLVCTSSTEEEAAVQKCFEELGWIRTEHKMTEMNYIWQDFATLAKTS